jgi:hypothetical protein
MAGSGLSGGWELPERDDADAGPSSSGRPDPDLLRSQMLSALNQLQRRVEAGRSTSTYKTDNRDRRLLAAVMDTPNSQLLEKALDELKRERAKLSVLKMLLERGMEGSKSLEAREVLSRVLRQAMLSMRQQPRGERYDEGVFFMRRQVGRPACLCCA